MQNGSSSFVRQIAVPMAPAKQRPAAVALILTNARGRKTCLPTHHLKDLLGNCLGDTAHSAKSKLSSITPFSVVPNFEFRPHHPVLLLPLESRIPWLGELPVEPAASNPSRAANDEAHRCCISQVSNADSHPVSQKPLQQLRFLMEAAKLLRKL